MGRATRLVPALGAILLATALAAAAAGGATTTSAPVTTTTAAPAASGGHCLATLGPGARWVRTTSPCEASLSRGSSATITLSSRFHWGPLVSRSGHVTVSTLSHPSTGGLSGTLRGRSLGTASVTAMGSAVCPDGVACPMFVLLWTLRVKVVAPSTTTPVTLTRADSGRVVSLAVGQRLVVSLASSSAYTWTTPTSGDAAVLARLSGSAGRGTFAGVAAGSTTVSAVDNPNCYPACLPPSELFSVTVDVT